MDYNGRNDTIQTTFRDSIETNDSSASSDGDDYRSEAKISWRERFSSLPGHEVFCLVPMEFIQEPFNLVGLVEKMPHFYQAINIILDRQQNASIGGRSVSGDTLQEAAVIVYGMIHARYILTSDGLAQMRLKYKAGTFGRCPRSFCSRQYTLPIGLADDPGNSMLKFYCPKCRDVYDARTLQHAVIDGSYFGPNFPHMFFMAFPDIRVDRPTVSYKPRLYGFKIHPHAYIPPNSCQSCHDYNQLRYGHKNNK